MARPIDSKDVDRGSADPETPVNHRTGITAADSADPTTSTGAIDCLGHRECRVDIYEESGTCTSLTVQALFWNATQSKYMRGASRALTEFPTSVVVAAQGAFIYMKVTALSGTTEIGIDYVLN